MKEEKQNSIQDKEVLGESIPDQISGQHTLYARALSGSGDGSTNDDDKFIQNPYLPTVLQKNAEKLLNQDFSAVNIYKDSSKAAEIGAKAFAQGDSIHFAPGHYNPYSKKGKELIAHELVHVTQQRKGLLNQAMVKKSSFGNIVQHEIFEREASQFSNSQELNSLFIEGSPIAGTLPDDFGQYIQMDPEILDEISYKTEPDGARTISLNIDSDGDFVFDLFCRITLNKDKKTGTISLKSTLLASDKEPVITENFELSKTLSNPRSEFYVVKQEPLTSMSPYRLAFAEDLLKIEILGDFVQIKALKEQVFNRHSRRTGVHAERENITFGFKHFLSSDEEKSLFLTPRFFFLVAPYNDKISIHFVQQKSEETNKMVLIPKIAIFSPDKSETGLQKSMSPISLDGIELDQVLSFEYLKIETNNPLFAHGIAFHTKNDTKVIYFTAYVSPVFEKDYSYANGADRLKIKNEDDERWVNFEVSINQLALESEKNENRFLVKGIQENGNYTIGNGSKNLAQQSQFDEAASIHAETNFKKKIQFENANQKWELQHFGDVIRNIKLMGSSEFNDKQDIDTHLRSAIAFFSVWDQFKQTIMKKPYVIDEELIQQLSIAARSYWNVVHEEGIASLLQIRDLDADSRRMIKYLSEQMDGYTYKPIELLEHPEKLLGEPLGLFDAEVQLSQWIASWYHKHNLFTKYKNDKRTPLGIILSNTELFHQKSQDLQEIKEKSVPIGKRYAIGGGTLSDFYTSRALFYPDRQEDNENITGIPVEIIVYKEMCLNLNGDNQFIWHIKAVGLNGVTHYESIDTLGGANLADNHEVVMRQLSDSDFAPSGKLFYQLIPESSNDPTDIIHGNVKLDGTDDNYGFLNSYMSYALAGMNLITAITPLGPFVFAATSLIQLANSSYKAIHKWSEGHFGLRDGVEVIADLAAAIFDVSGLVRSTNKLTFETIGLTIQGRPYTYFKFSTYAGLASDFGNGVIIFNDVLVLISQMIEEGKYNAFDIAKMLIFYGAQGTVLAVSGVSRGHDIMKMHNYKNFADQNFTQNAKNDLKLNNNANSWRLDGLKKDGTKTDVSEELSDYFENTAAPTKTGFKTQMDNLGIDVTLKNVEAALDEMNVLKAIRDFEAKKGSWLKNRAAFDKYTLSKKLKSKVVNRMERDQKQFIAYAALEYSEARFLDLTRFLHAEKMHHSEFSRMSTDLKLNAKLTPVEMAFLYQGFKKDKDKITQFLSDDAIKNNAFLIKNLIRYEDDLIDLFTHFSTNKAYFYERIAVLLYKGINQLETKKLKNLTLEKEQLALDIKSRENRAGTWNFAELEKLREKISRADDTVEYVKMKNEHSELTFKESEQRITLGYYNRQIKENEGVIAKGEEMSVEFEFNRELLEFEARKNLIRYGSRAKEGQKIEAELIETQNTLKTIQQYLKNEQNLVEWGNNLASANKTTSTKRAKTTKSSKNIQKNWKNLLEDGKELKSEMLKKNPSVDFTVEGIKKANERLKVLNEKKNQIFKDEILLEQQGVATKLKVIKQNNQNLQLNVDNAFIDLDKRLAELKDRNTILEIGIASGKTKQIENTDIKSKVIELKVEIDNLSTTVKKLEGDMTLIEQKYANSAPLLNTKGLFETSGQYRNQLISEAQLVKGKLINSDEYKNLVTIEKYYNDNKNTIILYYEKRAEEIDSELNKLSAKSNINDPQNSWSDISGNFDKNKLRFFKILLKKIASEVNKPNDETLKMIEDKLEKNQLDEELYKALIQKITTFYESQ